MIKVITFFRLVVGHGGLSPAETNPGYLRG
jgi:hypothetical protein